MNHRVTLLALAATIAACAEPATQPAAHLSPRGQSPSHDIAAPSSGMIDNFTSGSGTWLACGSGVFNYFEDPSIIGGARETYTRDAGSCFHGQSSKSNITIDATQGTMSWGGINTYSPEYGIAWGTEIGHIQPSWMGDANVTKGTPLHLSLSLSDKIQLNMAQVFSANPGVIVELRDASGGTYAVTVNLVVGSNAIPLSAFGIGAAAASDIAGIGIKTYGVNAPGDVFSGISVQPADNTPPVITPTVTGTLGNNGWYTSDVNVSWNVSDPDSPVSAKSGCDAVSVTSDTDGQTITCKATSAGGTSSQSVTIMRDATAPTVAYSGNAGSYTVDQTVSITCAANDATNPGSGLASSTCQNINSAAYTFAIGNNSVSAAATDNAGNTGNGSASFTVAVTAGSLCTLTQQWVRQPGKGGGIAQSLCVKLQHGQSDAYVNEVNAQSGKAIAADKAAILIALANHL